MQLNIFVHEFEYGVGHSKAMIEVLKRIPSHDISALNIICFQHDPPEKDFDHLKGKIHYHRVPGRFLKPFLLKFIFFQIYTALFWRSKKGQLNISMGVCSFVGDIINIQFCHFLWAQTYFTITKLGPLKWLYKKILFSYIIACENYIYSKKDISLVFLSRFMKEEFTKKFHRQGEYDILSYSSADFSRFSPLEQQREDILHQLKKGYSSLASLDINRPVSLFVGAYERKGLTLLLPHIPDDHQFIIIGKGESGSSLPLLKRENIFTITFTNEVERFYQACDLFIFPTLFEPFGLVIMEAAMCGMRVLTSQKYVGAMEILKDSKEIALLDPFSPQHQWISAPKLLLSAERKHLATQRQEQLTQLSWDKCSREWQGLLNLLINKNRA